MNLPEKIDALADLAGLHPEARLLIEMASFSQASGTSKMGTDRASCKFCEGTGLRVLRGDHATAVVSCLYCTPTPGPGTLIADKTA